MAKKIACELIIHGSYKQYSMGEFESKSKAKSFIQEIKCNKPYTIIPKK
jgi:hypothetical protein